LGVSRVSYLARRVLAQYAQRILTDWISRKIERRWEGYLQTLQAHVFDLPPW
jgi:hypothetical protein